MPPPAQTTFGDLLKQLRKRAGMTQGDLAAALGYSISLICALEQNRRLPDLQAVMQSYLPALGLQDEPRLAAQLVERAALLRGEKPPVVTIKRERRLVLTEEVEELAYHLPIPPTPLLGRAQDVQQLGNRLQGHNGRLLTLIGPPGVGKTRLALAVAGELQGLYRDGACFVPLAAVSDASLVAMALVTALNLQDGSSKSPLARVIEYLRRKELLLVLDNFEQILGAAPLVADLLAACAGLRILVTSRERLHLRAEQRYKVPPLELAAAVDLFMQRAYGEQPESNLAPPRAVIAQICRRIDCLPLAIELIAARTDLFTPAALLERLTIQRLALLHSGTQDLLPHQRTLTSAIAWSYHLLTAEQQHLLASLGVFSDGCTLAAAQQICAATLPELETLVAKSLLTVQPAAPASRFALLETIREFALLQLTTSGKLAIVQERHAAWFLQLAQTTNTEAGLASQALWFSALELEHNNLRTALRWSLTHQPPTALALVNALYEFWQAHGHLREAHQWLRAVLAAAPAPTPARAQALLHVAQTTRILGEASEALPLVEEGLALFQTLADLAGVAEAGLVQGWVFYDLHQLPAARAAFQQSHVHFSGLGNQRKMADALIGLLFSTPELHHQAAETRARLQEIQAIYRTLGNQRGVAFVLLMQSDLECHCGNYGAAITLSQEVVAIYRSLGDQHGLAGALYMVGAYLRYEARWAMAQQACAESVQLARQIGNKDCEMNALFHLATVERGLGNLQTAGACYRLSLQLCADLKNRHITSGCFVGLAALALQYNQAEQAALLLGAAQQLYDQLPAFLPPADVAEVAHLITTTQTALPAATFTAAWDLGKSWSLEDARHAAYTFCDSVLNPA